jgi:hypothetical protein
MLGWLDGTQCSRTRGGDAFLSTVGEHSRHTPPGRSATTIAAIAVADLVVIPCRPSPHDLRTVGVVVAMCQKAHNPHVLVPNAVIARSRLTGDAVDILHTMAPALKG